MSETSQSADRALALLGERAPDCARALAAAAPGFQDAARRVLAGSDFILDALVRDPLLLPQLLAAAPQRLAAALPLPAMTDEAAGMDALRRWRRA